MTYKELDSAFVAVELAVKDVIVRGAMLPDEERYSLQRIAESYGRRITTPAHIRAVLDCIDVNRLLGLIDAPPPSLYGATPCHNAPNATAP